MGLFKLFKRQEIEDTSTKESRDNMFEENNFKKAKINKASMKNFFIKAVGYITSQSTGRQVFTRPEYNLYEIKEAAEADSYIKIALSKYSYLIFKAG